MARCDPEQLPLDLVDENEEALNAMEALDAQPLIHVAIFLIIIFAFYCHSVVVELDEVLHAGDGGLLALTGLRHLITHFSQPCVHELLVVVNQRFDVELIP